MKTIPVRQLHELQKLDEHPAASTPRPISRADLVTLLNRHAPDSDFAADIAALKGPMKRTSPVRAAGAVVFEP